MVTRGDISLDVDDNLEPHDWPHISDVSVDMLKYSVHLPLEPKKLVWPGGEYQESDTLHMAADRSRAGVMRVLNVITSECRILSSRERCPYLVHVEVAETGMEGNDARLYASGAHDLGTTIGETLGMQPNGKENFEGTAGGFVFGKALPMYKIPSELLIHNDILHECESKQQNPQLKLQTHDRLQRQDLSFPERGGWQSHEGYPINERYDQRDLHFFQQQRYQEVDPSLMIPSASHSYPQIQNSEILPSFTTSSTLLDRVFGLPWALKCEQLRQASPFGKVNGWRLASFILKAGEDIRREALVMQVISSLNSWFKSDIPESLRPKMRPYTIMCVGGDAGLLECLSDAKSVDEVKKKTDGFTTLREYFERAYGPPQSQGANLQQQLNSDSSQGPNYSGISFETAQDNFLRSLVGYSLVCYILQIKDRHNANILMDREGHIMHIDFGYVLGDTPKMGKVPIFSERAPFKLSMEFWEVLGGWNYNRGGLGVKFCKMFEKAFACASSHSDEIVSLVEAALMNLTRNHNTAKTLANGIRHRLRMRGPPESVEQKTFVMELVNTALTCWSTTTYDWLQKNMNGYQ
jgi:phosphatidylinositol 4-kinase A